MNVEEVDMRIANQTKYEKYVQYQFMKETNSLFVPIYLANQISMQTKLLCLAGSFTCLFFSNSSQIDHTFVIFIRDLMKPTTETLQ